MINFADRYLEAEHKQSRYLLEERGQAVREADEAPGAARHLVLVQQVGRKDADEHEELLATKAHERERGLDQRDQLTVIRVGHLGQLLAVLVQEPAGAACEVGLRVMFRVYSGVMQFRLGTRAEGSLCI